jgi:hypothetical protein
VLLSFSERRLSRFDVFIESCVKLLLLLVDDELWLLLISDGIAVAAAIDVVVVVETLTSDIRLRFFISLLHISWQSWSNGSLFFRIRGLVRGGNSKQLGYLLWCVDSCRVYASKPAAFQCVFCVYTLGRIQLQHPVEKVERLRRHERILLTQLAPVNFFRLQRAVEWQIDNVGPNGGRWCATGARNKIELVGFGVCLENRLFSKQFPQNTSLKK